jgi:hypothetical protein
LIAGRPKLSAFKIITTDRLSAIFGENEPTKLLRAKILGIAQTATQIAHGKTLRQHGISFGETADKCQWRV